MYTKELSTLKISYVVSRNVREEFQRILRTLKDVGRFFGDSWGFLRIPRPSKEFLRILENSAQSTSRGFSGLSGILSEIFGILEDSPEVYVSSPSIHNRYCIFFLPLCDYIQLKSPYHLSLLTEWDVFFAQCKLTFKD